MGIERTSFQNSLMDVLDRVLDKGVVIDAWVRLSLVGIDLVTLKTRVVVASIETYLHHSAGPGDVKSTAPPRGEGPRWISLAESMGLAGAAAVPITAHDQFPPSRISPARMQVAPRMNT
jgi:gas vesicle structural protein